MCLSLALFSSFYPTSACSYVSFIHASSLSRFFFFLLYLYLLFINHLFFPILYLRLFFISLFSISSYRSVILSSLSLFLLYVCLSFTFLCSSFPDLRNKTCNRFKYVTTLAMKMTECVTPWILILRYQLWVWFAVLVFCDESRRTDLKAVPKRRLFCKGQTSLSSYAPFTHVQDQVKCRHFEPRHATWKGTIATNKDIHVYIAGSKNNSVEVKETLRNSCPSCGHAEWPSNVCKQTENRIIKRKTTKIFSKIMTNWHPVVPAGFVARWCRQLTCKVTRMSDDQSRNGRYT